ncbi:MAG: potassium transporter TrkG [Oscillospiraceae bacterium]
MKKKHVSYPMMIAGGFLILVLTGALLLCLPAATADGSSTRFIDAAFTATSASCVTGLVVFDTYTQWSVFGQLVILTMIQIGGLGFMTVITMFSLFLRRKIGLTERTLMRESINTMYVGGIVRLTKRILIGTLIFEGAGAILLSFRFVPLYGWAGGIYCGVFHSISAFCNAGFDIMGRVTPYSSLTMFADDAIVSLTIGGLIVIGGIGFFVWDDIVTNGLKFRKYRLHTKIVLVTTGILILVPSIAFWLFERHNLMADMSAKGQILSSLFSAITPRTAGFNSIDTAALTPASKLLSEILMFIGGSPGSTAGGIKTTTIAIILLSLYSNMHNMSDDEIFGRRLEDGAFKRASAVMIVNLCLILTACLVICGSQPNLPLTDIVFEAFSAMGTVGMSTGITRSLGDLSRVAIMILMFCGRVGSLSFALIFSEKRTVPAVRRPTERVNIG